MIYQPKMLLVRISNHACTCRVEACHCMCMQKKETLFLCSQSTKQPNMEHLGRMYRTFNNPCYCIMVYQLYHVVKYIDRYFLKMWSFGVRMGN